jgi:hypothetical protein
MHTMAFRTGVRGHRQVSPQAAFSQQATGLAQHAGLGQAFSQQATGLAQHAGAGHAFSQQATGLAQRGGLTQQTLHFGCRQGFSQQATGLAQHAGAGQAFVQTIGAGQAFVQTAGAAQTGFGQAFSQTAGAQAVSQPHFTLPQRRQANMSFNPLNRSRLQPTSQAAWEQAGSGAQHLTAGLQQAGAAQASQAPQPPQFSPAIRFNSSPLNPWLARATLTRSAPNTILSFIEQTLLYNGPR